MRTSIHTFGIDYLDEGIERVLANVRERGRLDEVNLAANYHDARDLLPHNPVRRIFVHEGDIAWFAPQPALYPQGTAPPVSSHAAGRDVLGEVADACADRGTRLNAWVIYCHNSRVSIRCPETAAINVYGDRLVGDLCPANPVVQDYASALTADVCRYDVAGIIGEWLHYRPLVHGHHHERYFVVLPDFARTLLGLCFCAHCRDYSTKAGFPLADFQTDVIDYLRPLWHTGRIDAPPEDLIHATARLLDIRTDIVAELDRPSPPDHPGCGNPTDLYGPRRSGHTRLP